MIFAGTLSQGQFRNRKAEYDYVVVSNEPEAIKTAEAFARGIRALDGSVFRYRVEGDDSVIVYHLNLPEDRDDECEQLREIVGF